SPPGPEENLLLEGEILPIHPIVTGVPHAILFVEDVEMVDPARLGRAIRYHERFHPEGTNVDFVSPLPGKTLAVRTYERGVEGETLACGTGAIAAALVGFARGMTTPPVTVRMPGGTLGVSFTTRGETFHDLFLEGPAEVIYEGHFYASPEADKEGATP
ncbi:MAG: diaminopimelate epimerase, partial [Deltaproteobacteria bacterium]